MENNPDEKNTPKEADSRCAAETADAEKTDASSWAADQKKHSYYYDDAHGYEIYDPEKEDEDDD